MKNCLNCKYEPEWGEPTGGEYPRRWGDCKYVVDMPPLPSVYQIGRPKSIQRYSDDSGVYSNCKVWEKKDED